VAVLALGGEYARPWLLAKLRDVECNTTYVDHLPEDWPGMGAGNYMEYALARIADAPKITNCRNLKLHEATWDPVQQQLTMEFTPGADARLAVNGRSLANLTPGRLEVRTVSFKGGGVMVR